MNKKVATPLSAALAEEESRLVAVVEFWRHRVRVERDYISNLRMLRAVLPLGQEDLSLDAAIKDMDLNLASEILQREHGLAKLENASKDLRSQFYGVAYGPKGHVFNTFEPLSFEKEVQWLQTIERKILKHDKALNCARKEASEAIERVEEGMLDRTEGNASRIAQKYAYKSFDDADLVCRRQTVITNGAIDKLKQEVAKSFDVQSMKEYRVVEALKSAFAAFASTQVDLAVVLNSSGVCSQLAASNISISVETSMLHCAMEKTLDHPLLLPRRYVNFEFGRWTKWQGQTKYLILFGRPLLGGPSDERANSQVIAAVHTLAKSYTIADAINAPQYNKVGSRKIQEASYEFESSWPFQTEPSTICSHLLMYLLDQLPDGPLLQSAGGPQTWVDETLLKKWNALLEAPTTHGAILSVIHRTLRKLAEESDWGLQNPALRVWGRILVGNEGFEKTVLAFLRPTLRGPPISGPYAIKS